jgi:hypothetical protein
MSGMDDLLAMAGGADLGALGAQLGLSPDQTKGAMAALLPAVLGGVKKAETAGALQHVAALANDIEDPTTVTGATDGGNSILGQIFGSKDVSRQVADHASGQTGISSTIMKALLPVVAAMVARQVSQKMGGGAMGGLAASVLGSMVGGSMGGGMQQSQGGGLGAILGGLLGGGGGQQAQAGGLGGLLGGLLGGGQQQAAPQASGGLAGLLGMLDTNHDGNPLDDILGMASKMSGR